VNPVFADTFYWVALSDPSDLQYRDAVAAESHLGGAKIITTDEVLSEFLTFFAADAWLRDRASRAVQELLNSSSVRVILQSRETFLAGLALYRQRPDKGYSLTDCISMQTMRGEGITEVLTNDRHFEQEGFRAWFRDTQ
jgi:predicted nucleic acid-binding protein